MKRAFTHKVEYFPSCAADNNALAKLSGGKLPGELANTVKANFPEVNRRTRTSAAMIGLAISMGASSLLLPNQSEEAIAAEPIAVEPTVTTSTALETAVELPTSTAELQPADSNQQAEALQAAIPDQALTVIEPPVQAEQFQLAPTSKVDEASLTTSNSFYAKSVPETQVERISPVGSIVKPVKTGEPEQITQSYKVDSPHFQPSAPTQLSPQLQVGQSVSFPSLVNDLLKATQQNAIEQLRRRSSNDLAQFNFEGSTNKLATPKIDRREFSLSLKPLTTKEAVQVQQPVVKGLETIVNSPSAVTSSIASPKKLLSSTVMPLLATTSSPVIMPVSLPATSVTVPVLIAPVAAKSSTATEFVKTTTSATPAVPKPVVVEPQQPVAKTTVYQVKPGDTVEEIAEAYTVTSKQLVRANKIDNPNIIQINQQLRIPTVNSTSLVSQIQPTSVNGSLSSQLELSTTKINQPSFPIGVLPAVLKQPLSSPKSFPATATLVSTAASNVVPQPKLLVAKESTSEDSSSNSQLMAEFSKLKQQYQPESQANTNKSTTPPTATPSVAKLFNNSKLEQQKLDQPQTLQANSKDLATPATITTPVSTLLKNNQPQQPSVPQLIQSNLKGQTTLPTVTVPAPIPSNSGNLQQESVQAQAIQANSKFSYTTAPIVIPVPSPLRNSEAEQPIQVQQKSSPSVSTVKPAAGAINIPVPSPQVATAPTEPSDYNPKIQTPIGDTVSPDFPSIQIPSPTPSSPSFQGYIWPAKGVFTSGYGRRWGRMHKGIDIAAPIGTPIWAVAPGIVVKAGWSSGGYGNLVEIRHPDGSTTRYAHNSRIWVAIGQEVQQGQQIAEMGSTGHSTGPHLHFELHHSGKGAVNPVAYLQRRAS